MIAYAHGCDLAAIGVVLIGLSLMVAWPPLWSAIRRGRR
jgi:hypothetical protein